MGWGIALAVILLLAVLPLNVKFRYDEDGVLVKARVWLLTVWKTPSGKLKRESGKNSGEKKPKKASSRKVQPVDNAEKSQPSGGSLVDFLPLVRVALELLSDFRKKLRVNRLDVKLVLAGDDPCDLAVNYGRVWAAIGNLIPVLERSLVMKKRNIDVCCDFNEEQTLIMADVTVSVTLGRLLYILVKHGVRGLGEYWNILKSRKGGTVL